MNDNTNKVNLDYPPETIHIERDKDLVAYLLCQTDITFLGSFKDGVVFFRFHPADKAREAIDAYYLRTAKPIQPIDLLNAVDRFWNLLNEEKRRQQP